MLEPIIDQITKSYGPEFEANAVLNDGRGTDGLQNHLIRHYSQNRISIDIHELQRGLRRLGLAHISKATVFGGYTGQFAKALRDMGTEVFFTDPMQVWVDQARADGFRAEMFSAEAMPSADIIEADVMATFECYMPFEDQAMAMYTSMRFLTTKYGIIFAESESTRDEMEEDSCSDIPHVARTAAMMDYLKQGYGLQSMSAKVGNLAIHRFSIPRGSREVVLTDLLILKTMHDILPYRSRVDADSVRRVADASHLPYERTAMAVRRMASMSEFRLKQENARLASEFRGEFWIGSNWLHLDDWLA